ncbi:GNAT family N-acetyltransferase [Pseudoalteromonas luteoviolacea]|uniref:GNAT family N-acetyltransferase n=1 Tax=Pseudoalteromonas luteoviolacea TaxID=43657 RepID=UPI001B36DC44|nr:GNAT family N-acetyltransferase [Pseudoalteromonas luteoviolacea]MBQ4810219.1 GNAT family N-acetyltransferase [Pseudoalteromonas luteoviolacea]
MTIKFEPLTKHDTNYSKVIDLFFEAFPKTQRLPPWIVKYRMRNGKAGFYALYDQDLWVGFIYVKEYKNIVFVKFFAISELRRSDGYGSKVMDSMKDKYSEQRVVLNIEELDDSADNFQQRVKRKAFYAKNGFSSTGYIVKEPAERQEMLIRGGTISKEEIEAMYKHFLGSLLYALLKPEILKI